MVRRTVRLIATVMLSVIVVTGVAWGVLALWFDGHSRARLRARWPEGWH